MLQKCAIIALNFAHIGETQMILRLSPTQLSMFFGCAFQYYQRYILGRIVPPGIALHMGSGLHAAADVNFTQKMATRKDMPRDVFEDAAEQEFNRRLNDEGVLLSKEEAGRSTHFLEECKLKTIEMARVLHDDVAPEIQPIAVEKTIEFTREATPGIVYTGRLDVLDETHDVIDVKSAKSRWGAGKAEEQDQPLFYLPGARETMGTKSEKFVYHIVTKAKTPTHQVVETTRDESDLVALEERAKTMKSMRDAGLFPPCDPGHWRCSPIWCGFYLAGCKYISKRKKMVYINRKVKNHE